LLSNGTREGLHVHAEKGLTKSTIVAGISMYAYKSWVENLLFRAEKREVTTGT